MSKLAQKWRFVEVGSCGVFHPTEPSRLFPERSKVGESANHEPLGGPDVRRFTECWGGREVGGRLQYLCPSPRESVESDF